MQQHPEEAQLNEDTNKIYGLGEIAEEDEPDESVNDHFGDYLEHKIEGQVEAEPGTSPIKAKKRSESKSPKVNGKSPKRKGPKGKSPKGKSPKGKSPKGKNVKAKSPKSPKSPKSRSPKNKAKGKSPTSKSPKADEKLKIKLPKSPKSKKIKSPKGSKKLKDKEKDFNPDETQTSRIITSSRDNNFRITKTTVNSGNHMESEEDITINHKNENSYPILNDDDNYKANEIKIKNRKAIKQQNKGKSPTSNKKAKSPRSPKSPKTTKNLKENGKMNDMQSPTHKKIVKKKTEPIDDLELQQDLIGGSGRKKTKLKKSSKNKSLHGEFRRINKAQAQGEKSKSKSPRRRSSKKKSPKHKKIMNGQIEGTLDIESGQKDENNFETEGAMLTQEAPDNLLATHRNLITHSKDEDFEMESESDDDRADNKKIDLENEDDLRLIEKNYPNVLEDIQEHTLFILRAIFDAYDHHGDKIVKYFRRKRVSKALQLKQLTLIDCPEELLRDGHYSESIVLNANQSITGDNDLTFLAGQNDDLTILNHASDASNDQGMLFSDDAYVKGRRTINKFGDYDDDEDARRRREGMFYGDEQLSENSHDTPEPVEEISILFDKGDGLNKPLNVDISDSLDGSENDIVYYHKEDMTNFSKNLGLNVVRTRALPEVGILMSESDTSRSKRKDKKRDRSDEIRRKLAQISGIYEAEPANSRRSRSKAFGYPLPFDFDTRKKTPITEVENSQFDSQNDDSKVLMKKLKKRKKIMENEELENRKKKFRALDLNAKKLKDKALLARKRARGRIKKFVDFDFFLDYESPYAEYLPARYREWMPKEQKRSDNNLMHMNASKLEDKLDEVSNIYRNEGSSSVNTSVMHSRVGKREKTHKPRAESMAPGPAEAIFGNYLDPAKPKVKESKFEGKRNSKSTRRNRKKPEAKPKPIELEEFDDTVEVDSDNDALKVFKKNYQVHPAPPISHSQIEDTFAVKSEKGPHIVPCGMDIESGRYQRLFKHFNFDYSDGEIIRPLFKGTFMPPKIQSSEMNSRVDSREDKMVIEEIKPLRHNFTTAEGMYDNVKQSEISSQVIELIDANDSDLDKSEEHHEQVVKINPLF